MLGKIYKITNLVNGKIYVGQTTKSLKERFQRHCWGTTEKDSYHLNMAIKKAIKKYGKNNFTIELIEEVETDKLDEREVYWISYYDSYNKGYNCTIGGQNGATRHTKLSWTEENEVIEAKYLGFSIAEIEKAYNIDRTTVHNIFKRHDLKMPNRRNLVNRINIEEFEEFLKMNPTVKQIEKKFNICRCSIYNYMKKHNIEYNFPTSVQTLTGNAEG
jgi:group I intron endonuclease